MSRYDHKIETSLEGIGNLMEIKKNLSEEEKDMIVNEISLVIQN